MMYIIGQKTTIMDKDKSAEEKAQSLTTAHSQKGFSDLRS